MKDKLNQELNVGDKVVFMLKNYRSLKFGTIHSFTPQKARISYTYQNHKDTFLQEPNQVVRVNDNADDVIKNKNAVIQILSEEISRLKAGRFTEEEFQNLCHTFSEDDECGFKQGCLDYQAKLFGCNKNAGH